MRKMWREEESVEHAFMGCDKVVEIWHLGVSQQYLNLRNGRFEDWVREILLTQKYGVWAHVVVLQW